MEPSDAVADFQRRLRALAARRSCHEMIAWEAVRQRPQLLDLDAVRPVVRLRSRPLLRALLAPPTASASADASASSASGELAASTRGSAGVCVACGERLRGNYNLLLFVPCNHAMHSRCGKVMIQSYKDQGKDMPYACPCVAGCRGVVKSLSGKGLVPSADGLPRVYVPCPGANCSRLVLSFREGPHAVKCAGCGTGFCHSCRQLPHDGGAPCVVVVANAAVMERADAVRRALGGVSLDGLCLQMAAQHYRTTPTWMFIESLFQLSPETMQLQLQEPVSASPALRGFSSDELISLAREVLKPNWAAASQPPPAPPPTVLDDALAALGLSDEFFADGGGGTEAHSKFCPMCFVRIVRIEGCPEMRCRCGHAFCYDCLGPAHTHSHCTRAVDVAALRLAAERVGESAGVVAGLALFSDESEHFNESHEDHRRRANREDEMRRHRIQRLIPLLLSVEKLATLTLAGVAAPKGAVANARLDLVRALEREEAIGSRTAIPIAERLRVQRADQLRMARSEDVLKYAKLRVVIAQERASRRLVSPELADSRAWFESARGLLSSQLYQSNWLLSRLTQVGSLVNRTIDVDSDFFTVIDETETTLHISHANKEGGRRHGIRIAMSRAALRVAVADVFKDDVLCREADAELETLWDRVVAAALVAARATMFDARRPALPARAAITPRAKVGDVVVRGPAWHWNNQDHVAGNHAVVNNVVGGTPNGAYDVEVTWLFTGYNNLYSSARQEVVKVADCSLAPPTEWCDLLVALTPKMAISDRRAAARLLAVLAPSALTGSRLRPDASVVRSIAAVDRVFAGCVQQQQQQSQSQPQPPSPLPPMDEGWSCERCTLINARRDSRCEACEAPCPRPAEAAASEAPRRGGRGLPSPPTLVTSQVMAFPALGRPVLNGLARALRL